MITADVIQPTHAGAGLLYLRQYFTLARGALTGTGVMVQWIGLRSRQHYELIARTFQHVFPETTVWVNGSLLIGSVRPLQVDAARLAKRFAVPALRPSLTAAGFTDPAALLAHYVAGPDQLRRFVGNGPILTDDRPLLDTSCRCRTTNGRSIWAGSALRTRHPRDSRVPSPARVSAFEPAV